MSSAWELAEPVLPLIEGLLGAGAASVFVGIDGRSGSGKSTLATALAGRLLERGVTATLIEGDSFYGGGSAATWDRRRPAENVDRVIDWRRQRAVLRRLRTQGSAAWPAFDWDAEGWDTDTVPQAAEPLRARAASVVILEGAYSCRPELRDLLDLCVLVEAPAELRRRRLLEREGADLQPDWAARWSAAEDRYFGAVVPPSSFELVLRAS